MFTDLIAVFLEKLNFLMCECGHRDGLYSVWGVQSSQDPRAGGTDEGAHCHVDIGRAALVAVEAFPIRGQASHLPEHLQMSLLLLSLRIRRHG